MGNCVVERRIGEGGRWDSGGWERKEKIRKRERERKAHSHKRITQISYTKFNQLH